MKKLILFTLLSISHFSYVYAFDFLDITIEKAIEKAKIENKNILLYFTADWCGPCKYMEKNVFNNDSVKTYIQENFIAIKINESTWRGEKITNKYKIYGFPTFIILDKQGVEINNHIGLLYSGQLLKFFSNELPIDSNQKKLNTIAKSISRKTFQSEFGVRFAGISSQITHEGSNNKIGTGLDVFVAFEKNRILIRPMVGYLKNGNANNKLNYLITSLDLGLTFKKGAIFGLPGGYRIIASPYYSFLLNSAKNVFYQRDLGLKYGVSAYVGETSKIELQLFSSNGFIDIDTKTNANQRNQLFGIGCALTF